MVLGPILQSWPMTKTASKLSECTTRKPRTSASPMRLPPTCGIRSSTMECADQDANRCSMVALQQCRFISTLMAHLLYCQQIRASNTVEF